MAVPVVGVGMAPRESRAAQKAPYSTPMGPTTTYYTTTTYYYLLRKLCPTTKEALSYLVGRDVPPPR